MRMFRRRSARRAGGAKAGRRGERRFEPILGEGWRGDCRAVPRTAKAKRWRRWRTPTTSPRFRPAKSPPPHSTRGSNSSSPGTGRGRFPGDQIVQSQSAALERIAKAVHWVGIQTTAPGNGSASPRFAVALPAFAHRTATRRSSAPWPMPTTSLVRRGHAGTRRRTDGGGRHAAQPRHRPASNSTGSPEVIWKSASIW